MYSTCYECTGLHSRVGTGLGFINLLFIILGWKLYIYRLITQMYSTRDEYNGLQMFILNGMKSDECTGLHLRNNTGMSFVGLLFIILDRRLRIYRLMDQYYNIDNEYEGLQEQEQATRIGRPQKEAILEWIRLYRDSSGTGKAGDLRTVLVSRRSETVGRRRSRSRSRGRSRKRVAPEGSDHTQKRRRSLTPFTVNRPEKEPRLILDSAEHSSCGKFVSSKGKGKGRSTQARLVTQDEVEERNVVFQMDVDNVEMVNRLLGYEDSD